MASPARQPRAQAGRDRPRLEMVQGQSGPKTATMAAVPAEKGKWVVLALDGVGTFMTTLDSSIVNISLPAIARSFGTPLSGTLADRMGSRWLASGGLAVSCLGLLMLGRLNAQSSIFDIVWRLAVIGVGITAIGIFTSLVRGPEA